MPKGKWNRPRTTVPILERLMRKVERSPNGCWLFTGCKLASEYGKIAAKRSHPVFAHRVSYEEHIGPIPEGKMVLHRCDVPACVNPEHLFLGDARENWRDARQKGRNYPAPQQTPNYRYVHWTKVVGNSR